MLTKAVLIGAFAALAAAQSKVLFFTHVPNPVTDGQPQALTYSTNDTTTPVTIILRKGSSGDLQTVSNITTDATGGQYVWTPPTSLADGVDYALEITQAEQVNYFGPFVVQGFLSSSSSASSTQGPSVSYSSATIVIPITTLGSNGTSAGTGTALPRNTTMSRPTLSSTSASSTPASASAAQTSGAGFQGSSSASAASSSSTSGASAGIQIGSTFSLFGALAAAFFAL